MAATDDCCWGGSGAGCDDVSKAVMTVGCTSPAAAAAAAAAAVGWCVDTQWYVAAAGSLAAADGSAWTNVARFCSPCHTHTQTQTQTHTHTHTLVNSWSSLIDTTSSGWVTDRHQPSPRHYHHSTQFTVCSSSHSFVLRRLCPPLLGPMWTIGSINRDIWAKLLQMSRKFTLHTRALKSSGVRQ